MNYSFSFFNHKISAFFLLCAILCLSVSSSQAGEKVNSNSGCSDLLNTQVKTIEGEEISLCKYQGKVLLIVNTASKCGFTKQYADLENLYDKYKADGFEVLAFPSNDFADQEPGNEEQIKKFCSANFNVTFPLHAKSHVKGKNKSDLYLKLSSAKGDVQWNFQKYLVNRKGQVIKKFAPWTSPLSPSLEDLIKEELKK